MYIEPQKILNTQSNLDEKNKAGGITVPDLNYITKL